MGTYLRVLSEVYPMNTNMTGFRWFSKFLHFSALYKRSLSIGRVNFVYTWWFHQTGKSLWSHLIHHHLSQLPVRLLEGITHLNRDRLKQRTHMYVLSVLVKEQNKMKCIDTPEPIKPFIANANSNDDLVKLKIKMIITTNMIFVIFCNIDNWNNEIHISTGQQCNYLEVVVVVVTMTIMMNVRW